MRNKPELHSRLACIRNLCLIDVLELAKQRFFQPPIDEVTRGSRETLFVTTSIRHPDWMPELTGKLRARITTVGPDFSAMDNRFYSDKKSHSGFREDQSFVGVQ